MDLDQIVMKTEIQPNGDILLYYVNDNNQEVDTTTSGIVKIEQQEDIQMLSETKYVIEDTGESESADELDLAQASTQLASEQWTDEELKRLIVFYIDNKDTFRSGTTKKKHLWAVACRTMLQGKQPLSCEYKLREYREKYFLLHSEKLKGAIQWPFFSICHQAFQEENPIDMYLNVPNKVNENIKKEVTSVKKLLDTNVDKMLNLYLKYKNIYANNTNSKAIWERIARDMNEKDVDYWYKRFLNYKQHYIKMLHKRIYSGDDSVHWPYMRHFDEIFANDEEFQKKFVLVDNTPTNEWNDTETTFLCKYYFDCLHEFQDPTIPDDFLWHDVGRLLEKPAENCNQKLNSLKREHIDKLLEGNYDLNSRLPWEIVLDNIIYMETVNELENNFDQLEEWDTDLLDTLVQYVYDNINMVKDTVCFFVCLCVVAKKLNCGVIACKNQWDNLVEVYKSILNDKKEHPEIQIDWRYIELFDVIFDYGMDTNLLDGYKKIEKKSTPLPAKLKVKKINMNDLDDNITEDIDSEEMKYDERGFTIRVKRDLGKVKGMKILEYYIKNKDKFNSPNYKKTVLWNTLSKEIGISATECAHRFRNFKQIYLSHVQREITKPEMPIVWPYFAICKKAFGYRAIKAKLKTNKPDLSDTEEWSHEDITKLINFAASNINIPMDKWNWADIADETDHTANGCLDKYCELRRCYRKLKTLITNNPEKRVSWKYFSIMDKIYTKTEETNDKNPEQDEDDFQCLIVIPEGQDINQAQIIYPNENAEPNVSKVKPKIIWNRQSKTKLLNLYLKYIKQEITPKEIWKKISSEMDGKSPILCKRMFVLLKKRYENQEDAKYKKIIKEIIELQNTKLPDDLSDDKVETALNFYLRNIEDFLNPKLKKDVIWSELGASISVPVDKIQNKINYLKNLYAIGEKTPFQELLKEITEKENSFKILIDNTEDSVWIDSEIETLLTWYLAHLDKFKNPKFVRSYLWMEASDILKKTPLDCSNKMLEIRAEYRTMFKENPEKLQEWKFYNLCQRIYGTGKKANE